MRKALSAKISELEVHKSKSQDDLAKVSASVSVRHVSSKPGTRKTKSEVVVVGGRGHPEQPWWCLPCVSRES
jgi:hypothetical protein